MKSAWHYLTALPRWPPRSYRTRRRLPALADLSCYPTSAAGQPSRCRRKSRGIELAVVVSTRYLGFASYLSSLLRFDRCMTMHCCDYTKLVAKCLVHTTTSVLCHSLLCRVTVFSGSWPDIHQRVQRANSKHYPGSSDV